MKKKKILLVDDEVDFKIMLTMRLRANDYDVVTAANGTEALEQVKKEKPDGVLLDIMMPEIDGLTVLKKIREMDQKLPVFMITSFSNEARFVQANALNATGYIVKTSDLKEEVKKIKTIIG